MANNKKRVNTNNLPKECIGQFKNPEVQKKAAATRAKNLAEKKARKDAAATGFSLSNASDPSQQAKLIDKLWAWALEDDPDMAKWAIKMLNDMGVTKQPAEKPEEPAKSEAKRDPKKAVDFLKRSSKGTD